MFLFYLLFFIYINELKLSQIFWEVWNFHYLVSYKKTRVTAFTRYIDMLNLY